MQSRVIDSTMISRLKRIAQISVFGLLVGLSTLILTPNDWKSEEQAPFPLAPRILANSTRIAAYMAEMSIHEDNTKDGRFRKEIAMYFNQIHLPRACEDVNRSLPKPVQSQEEHGGCSVPRVPNIVHLVWLYGRPHAMIFRQLLSVLSVLRFIQPCAILFWYDGSAPRGQYWQHFLRNVSSQNIDLRMLNITVPNKIWGKEIHYIEHATDIIRFEVLKHFGGIYMDLDVLILKSLRPLRCYDYTLGREDYEGLTGSLILSVPKSPFLLKIIENYQQYSKDWTYNSVRYPHQLAEKEPSLIHVEEDTINKPNWYINAIKAVFEKTNAIKWQKNYAIHLWNHASREYIKFENANSIKTMNTTFGEVARHIYYGSPDKIYT